SDLGVDSGHFSSAPGEEFSILLQASFKLFFDQVGESNTNYDTIWAVRCFIIPSSSASGGGRKSSSLDMA
ncbi:hypothetical protein A2U01_0097468, partial [Trifolium medium]|nr:hypothetical protein [Trifolium medium]